MWTCSHTLLTRLGIVPLALFFLLMPLVDGVDSWLRDARHHPAKIEDAVPFLHQWPLLSFLFYLFVLDFVAYWLHRWQHRFEWWWALHALHHSQRQMGFGPTTAITCWTISRSTAPLF